MTIVCIDDEKPILDLTIGCITYGCSYIGSLGAAVMLGKKRKNEE